MGGVKGLPMGAITLLFFVSMIALCSAAFQAGVAKVDGTLPIGVPIAGYNHGDRRVKKWPIPSFTRYTTWLTPSQVHTLCLSHLFTEQKKIIRRLLNY